jgi:hypothetical protein
VGRGNRRSGESARRPPFGAPRQHWWGHESPEEWWLGQEAQDRLRDDPAYDRLRDDPAYDQLRGDPAYDQLRDDPAYDQLVEDPPYDQLLGEPAPVRLLEDPAHDRAPHDPARRRWLDATARHRWLDAATRHPWYTALGAGATFVVLASGVIAVLPKQAPSAMMTKCGLVPCPTQRQSPAIPVAGMATSGTARGRNSPAQPQASPSPTPAASTLPVTMASPGPSADPSAPASVAPQLPPGVTVTYAIIVQWPGSMLGEFTVANSGSVNITGWELSAAFPGDQIQATWGPVDSNPDSDTVVMEAQPGWPAIAPGTSQSGYFIARGETTSPSDCTFNGISCFDDAGPGQAGQ